MDYRSVFEAIHDSVVQAHEKLVGDLMVMREPIQKGQVPTDVLVDVGFLLREMQRHLDEMRKDAKAREELIGRILCLQSIRAMQGGEAVSLKGQLATGSPKLGYSPQLPELGTPDYDDLMAFLKVPKEAYGNKLVVPHWKHVQELLNELAEQGKDSPPGVKQKPEYKTIFTRRKKRDAANN